MKGIELTGPAVRRGVVSIEFNFSVLAEIRGCPISIATIDHIVVARANFYATCSSVTIAKIYVS